MCAHQTPWFLSVLERKKPWERVSWYQDKESDRGRGALKGSYLASGFCPWFRRRMWRTPECMYVVTACFQVDVPFIAIFRVIFDHDRLVLQ